MKQQELNEIVRKHKLWLENREGGECANLCGANLCGANLCGANLRRANLREADLSRANLRWANLCGANLCGANLRWANLCGADLCGADLREANLRGADLDYSVWPLWCGSLDVKIDRRIFAQLAYHLCRVEVDDEECVPAQKALYDIANTFHRADECGRLGEAERCGEEEDKPNV